MDEKNMTKEERLFCELYITGGVPFIGNPSRCYEEAFNYSGKLLQNKALTLLSREDVKAYIEKLCELHMEETKHMKEFLTQNLMSIVTECATDVYRDRKGAVMSPAALRSVAVNASKALMEMYPVKEAQVNKLSIEGAEGDGITFNVIMPSKPKEDLDIE